MYYYYVYLDRSQKNKTSCGYYIILIYNINIIYYLASPISPLNHKREYGVLYLLLRSLYIFVPQNYYNFIKRQQNGNPLIKTLVFK